jgi:hypothetical protein
MDRPTAHVLNAACDLDLLRVRSSEGRMLGRVFDLRCDWRPGQKHAPVIDEIIFGRKGLAERLGLRHGDAQSAPWSAVLRIEGRTLVVAADQVKP